MDKSHAAVATSFALDHPPKRSSQAGVFSGIASLRRPILWRNQSTLAILHRYNCLRFQYEVHDEIEAEASLCDHLPSWAVTGTWVQSKMNKKNPRVDAVLGQERKWPEEFEALRAIALDFPLTEELKWYQACYTLEGKNIALIHGFKEYCALMFFKGALLKDPKRILATPGQHQSARQIRFANLREIVAMKPTLKAYIREAIQVEKAGLKVKLKKTADFKLPVEFQKKLHEDPALKAAFRALTPGRQRQYIFHFSQPKQSKTREARVEKCAGQILLGKGLTD